MAVKKLFLASSIITFAFAIFLFHQLSSFPQYNSFVPRTVQVQAAVLAVSALLCFMTSSLSFYHFLRGNFGEKINE